VAGQMAGLRPIHSGANDKAGDAHPIRCLCNKLVCIRYGDVIEIKCNKCKRMISIYTKGIERVEIR